MKTLISILSFTIFSFAVMAQTNNAIFFTENGEKFQVIVNGVLQNATPETNVKVSSLNANSYKVRIMFADTKLGYVDYNMFFQTMGSEVTYNVKQNNKGAYVVRYISEVPVAQAPQPAPTQTVVIYSTTPPAPQPAVISTTTTTVQQSHSTTTTGTNGDNINISLGMNVTGDGGGINISASGLDGSMNDNVSHSATTTTTTTHTVVTSGTAGAVVATPAPAPVVYVSGYNGAIGCPAPMNPNDFSGMKESIRSKDFENTKLTIAKQVLQNNCLTSQQVREVMSLFDFEASKLDYAKYAYDHTYDIGNYYKVNDAFEFESSTDDLSRYINGRR